MGQHVMYIIQLMESNERLCPNIYIPPLPHNKPL